MRSFLVCLLAVAGCAKGSGAHQQADAAPGTIDAAVDSPALDAYVPDTYVPDAFLPDAFVPDAFVPDAFVPDAFVPDAFVPDAFVPDAAIDAPMADAPPDACVPVTTQLLVNPVFDLTPVGTGWTQTPIDPMYPLITDQDGIAEQTAPYKAWLGGIESSSGSVTDVLYQDVAIPANTTQLTLTGYYEVRSGEDPADTGVYDTATLGVTQTNGTPIVGIGAYNNTTVTTAWTPISYTFTQNLAGQTIRFRMTSSNDILNATSFYFDSFALNATHCP